MVQLDQFLIIYHLREAAASAACILEARDEEHALTRWQGWVALKYHEDELLQLVKVQPIPRLTYIEFTAECRVELEGAGRPATRAI